MTFTFYLPTFSNTLSNKFSIPFSISFKYYFFHSLFILFLTIIFFNEKCYVHNILRNTFTTKFMWKVVTSSNLTPLKLFFYSLILTNNNLLFKIYCENIVVVFFNQDFLFFILFFFLSFHFHPRFISFFLFSFSCFSPPHKTHSPFLYFKNQILFCVWIM